MNTPKVAVVILSWNGKKYLEQFLPSVVQTTYYNLDIYVADNASTDDSVVFVKATYPSIKIIEIEKNEGFAKGYNVALKQVNADYFILLNQDVEVTPGWIEPVIELMQTDPLIAACQPKIRAFHNKTHFEYAGAAGGWIDLFGYTFCRGRIFDHVEEDKGQYDDTAEIFWASGAAMFIKSKVFLKYDGFDAALFAHMEEIDLCWRLKNRGYKIMYCPQSVVYHVGGGSLAQDNPFKTYLNFRNNLILLLKNLSVLKSIRLISARLLLDHIAAYRALLKGNPKEYTAIAKAHFHFIKGMRGWMREKKRIKKLIGSNGTMPNAAGIYKGSILADYFLKRKKTFTDLNIHS